MYIDLLYLVNWWSVKKRLYFVSAKVIYCCSLNRLFWTSSALEIFFAVGLLAVLAHAGASFTIIHCRADAKYMHALLFGSSQRLRHLYISGTKCAIQVFLVLPLSFKYNLLSFSVYLLSFQHYHLVFISWVFMSESSSSSSFLPLSVCFSCDHLYFYML